MEMSSYRQRYTNSIKNDTYLYNNILTMFPIRLEMLDYLLSSRGPPLLPDSIFLHVYKD